MPTEKELAASGYFGFHNTVEDAAAKYATPIVPVAPKRVAAPKKAAKKVAPKKAAKKRGR